MAGSGKTLPHAPNGWLAVIKHGAALVAGADQLEQDGGFRLVLADIGEVIEDQQVEAVEPVDGGLEGEFAARDLQPLHQVGGAGEQHAPAVLHQRQADGRGEMRLAAAGCTDEEQVGALLDPTVAGAERQSPAPWRSSAPRRSRSCRGSCRAAAALRRDGARCGGGRARRSRARQGRRGSARRASLPCPRARRSSARSCLIAGKRRSLSSSVSRAASMVVGHAASPGAALEQRLVGDQRREMDDDLGQARRIRREAGAQRCDVGQLSCREIVGEQRGELGLAGALMRQASSSTISRHASLVRRAARAADRRSGGRPRGGTAGRGRPG